MPDENKRTWSGRLMMLDTWSVDGRLVTSPTGDLRSRELPMPLLVLTPPGTHIDNATPNLAGMIDTVQVVPGDEPHVWGTGTLDLGEVRRLHPELANRLESGEPCGIGADFDQVEFTLLPGDESRGEPVMQVDTWRFGAAHLNDNPAWPQCTITLDPL